MKLQEGLDVVTSGSDVFLRTVSSEGSSALTTTLLLNEMETVFKLDTGVEVTAISKSVYENLRDGKLRLSSRSLYGLTCQPLKVVGQFEAPLARGQKTTTQTIFVIDGLQTCLLGLFAISSLQLAYELISVKMEGTSNKDFPHCFVVWVTWEEHTPSNYGKE